MEQANCPNCGAPLTGYGCEYCGTVDPATEAEIQRLRAEITELWRNDLIMRQVDSFISVMRPFPPPPPTTKKKR